VSFAVELPAGERERERERGREIGREGRAGEWESRRIWTDKCKACKESDRGGKIVKQGSVENNQRDKMERQLNGEGWDNCKDQM